MATIEQALSAAMHHHRAGRLAEAETLYRQILAIAPNHSEALFLLGALAQQAGRHELAIDLIRRAIEIDPSRSHYHHQLGEVYQLLGRVGDARAAFERSIEIDPRSVASYFHLGLLETGLGHLGEAERRYRQALEIAPKLIEALVNLGDVLRHAGRLEEAAASYRLAIAERSDCVEATHNLGAVLLDLECFAEAATWLETSRALRPQTAEIHYNLGNAYRGLGRTAEAVACFQEAIRLRADFAQPLFALAGVEREQWNLEAAAEMYRKALGIDPDYVDALANCGKVLHVLGQSHEALACYNRALKLKPDMAVVHFNRAVLFNDLAQPDEALALSRAGLQFEPNSARLYGNMAVAMHFQGRAREAIEYYRRAVEQRLSSAIYHSNLLYALNFCEGYDPQTVFEEHLAWAERHAEPLTAAAPPVTNDPTPDRRLRIGYVSPYFRHHAVNYFTEPILLAHDHTQFEVFCYSDVRRTDDVTERIRASADHWRDTRALSDEQIAQQVRDDKVDILVDLTGHIGGSRLLVFARKPAPVQVTYIGYQNTTGMSAMDYRLTDAHADPPGLTDRYYTEKLVRLEPLFFCYRPMPDAPAVNPLPAASNGYVTFGSFNNFMKVSDHVLDTWLEILARVPRSRLLVLSYREGYVEEHLRGMAAAKGISGERIELFNKMPTDEFLRLQQRADIALDPFPFNGHTTTCDSLWLGLPVVTLEGQTYAERFGGSALVNLGLDAWITRSTDEYIDCAVKLASDVGALARWRAELRPHMAHGALLDHQGFTRRLEAAYRRMWLDWCRTRSTMT